MTKITGLFFTTLFLCYVFTHSARPEPPFQEESAFVTHHQDAEAMELDERCEGVGAEECLMRRTLAAHTDYIYTQKHHH